MGAVMQIIPLQAIANQTLTIQVDDNQWVIGVRDANGNIAVSLFLNGAAVVENARAVSGMRIIQSKYQEAGNFVISTQNQEIPDFTKFGVTQFLLYFSQAEVDAIRSNPPVIWTASDFDPAGAIPLRFSPQGYVLA